MILFEVLIEMLTAIMMVASTLYYALSITSISRNYRNHVWLNPKINPDLPNYPRVTVIVPLYHESKEEIIKTLESIAAQRYPHDKLDIVLVVEREDKETLNNLRSTIDVLNMKKLNYQILIKDTPRSCKAAAINYALSMVDASDVFVVYDGGDIIEDEFQIAKAVSLIRNGFDVIGVKVYRVGSSLIGFMSYIDSLLWCNVMLPALVKLVSNPLFSGEGLFLSAKFINEINGLPEKLTEDSYLAIYLSKLGKRGALLDSVIVEAAPINVGSFIKQRIRWFRGYAQCIRDVLLFRSIPLDVKAKLIVSYLSPYSLISLSLSSLILALSLFLNVPWYLLFASIYVVIGHLIAPMYLLSLGVRDIRIFLAPFYWFFLGLIAILSIIIPKVKWYKTAR